MSEPLDALDVRILDLLQDDVTLPVAEIAERVASSKTVVWRRMQKLVDSGVIRERVAIVDHHKAGLGIMVFAHVKMTRHHRDALPIFLDAARKLPPVIECHTLMGDADFLLKIVVPSVRDYEDLVWNKLSQIDGVQGIRSSISKSQSINNTRLPFRAAQS